MGPDHYTTGRKYVVHQQGRHGWSKCGKDKSKMADVNRYISATSGPISTKFCVQIDTSIQDRVIRVKNCTFPKFKMAAAGSLDFGFLATSLSLMKIFA